MTTYAYRLVFSAPEVAALRAAVRALHDQREREARAGVRQWIHEPEVTRRVLDKLNARSRIADAEPGLAMRPIC